MDLARGGPKRVSSNEGHDGVCLFLLCLFQDRYGVMVTPGYFAPTVVFISHKSRKGSGGWGDGTRTDLVLKIF